MDHLSEDDWAVIPAGETVTAEHNGELSGQAFPTLIEPNCFTVSALYDFSAAGPGTFTFEPTSGLRAIGFNDTVRATNAVHLNIADARSVTITVTDDVSKRSLHLDKRRLINCPDRDQTAFILSSQLERIMLAYNAISYVNGMGSHTYDFTKVYLAYFANIEPKLVVAAFNEVANADLSSRTLSCPDRCPGSLVANTDVQTGDIYFCPPFFNQVDSTKLCNNEAKVDDNNIRGVTAIRQMFRAIGGKNDYAVGCSKSRNLHKNAERLGNIDSYGVSPKTPLSPHVLTGDHNHCSASLPKCG